jgi:hypothetical protein
MPRQQPQDESAPITKMTSANQTFVLNPLLTRVPMSRRLDQGRKCGLLVAADAAVAWLPRQLRATAEELLHVSNEWATFASLATAFGTLVLAIATFASIRSANRSARVAQQALAVNLRPLLIASRLNDPPQKVFFQEGNAFRLDGGRGFVEFDDGTDVVYLGLSLRNSGQGIGVIHGWRFQEGRELDPRRPDPETFRRQQLDLAIAPGDVGYWEGAVRDSADPQRAEAIQAAKETGVATIDLLYGDYEGGQRVITRMMLRRFIPEDGDRPPSWLATAVRHWNLDRPDPR